MESCPGGCDVCLQFQDWRWRNRWKTDTEAEFTKVNQLRPHWEKTKQNSQWMNKLCPLAKDGITQGSEVCNARRKDQIYVLVFFHLWCSTWDWISESLCARQVLYHCAIFLAGLKFLCIWDMFSWLQRSSSLEPPYLNQEYSFGVKLLTGEFCH